MSVAAHPQATLTMALAVVCSAYNNVANKRRAVHPPFFKQVKELC